MSRLLGRTTQKVKEKTGQVFNRLRPSSQQDRATPPVPSDQRGYPVDLDPPSHSGISTGDDARIFQLPITLGQVDCPASGPSAAAPTAEVAVLVNTIALTALSSAESSSTRTFFTVAASAVDDLAGRRGSALILPLKAALIAIIQLTNTCNGIGEIMVEIGELQSKLRAFDTITNLLTTVESDIIGDVQDHINVIYEITQRLWRVLQEALGRDTSRPAQPIQKIDQLKPLLNILSSLLDVFSVDDTGIVSDRFAIVRQRLFSQQQPIASEPPSLNIVSHTGNITYNLGRDVVNNSYIHNYVFAYETAHRGYRLVERQEKAMKRIRSVLGDNFVSEAADDEQPSYTGCMAGTRVDVLLKFVAWAKDDPMSILWLAGMAGTGKTSIAVSLCRILGKDPAVLLAGGYFCSRSSCSIARTDVRRILPTLAVLLAAKSPEFAEALAAELDGDSRVGHKPVGEQIEPLIRKPLAALAPLSPSLVFLVDALDECSNNRELAELLKVLADFKCGTNLKVKFILTSRPEMHIRGTSISNPDHSTILHLQAISEEQVRSDIRLYVGNTLKDAAAKSTWYTDRDVECLVEQSDSLFIFASTVLLYILDPDEDDVREERLRKATSAVAKGSAVTSPIDKIYGLVLTEASRPELVDADELEEMRRIIACLLMARMPLSVQALAELLELRPGKVKGALRRLHSLVHLPSSNTESGIRILHASIGDFLFERAPIHIRISPALGHDVLAFGCLQRLSWDDLCFNVARSQSSFEPNPETAPEWMSLSLNYACLQWAHHIDKASTRSAFDEYIGRTFRAKLLFWLEVLSIMGNMGLASGLLLIADSAVNLPSLSLFLRDGNAFVASSYAAISRSASHIYISALPFAAKDSLVFRDFAPLCASLLPAKSFGINRHGGRLLMTLVGHQGQVRSVSYSPDGRILASGSDDGTIRIWDTRTGGEVMLPLRSGEHYVTTVAFTPNGEKLASATEGSAVHIWDVAAGRVVMQPLHGSFSWSCCMSISQDGMLIASSSGDYTIRLWSTGSGQAISVITGHTGDVYALAFSPDGLLLASGSVDKTVRLWNIISGEAIGNPLTNLGDTALCLAFSPNSRYLAAGSHGTGQVRIWDLQTLDSSLVVTKTWNAISSLAFSHDGSRLVAAVGSSIQFWDLQTGQEISGTSLNGHSALIHSIALSPDGLYLASGSVDRTVRIWDAVSSPESVVQASLQAHTDVVTSAVLSTDGTFIVSSSHDFSIRVWDTINGEMKLPPMVGHQGWVFAVAISSDGRLIASGSGDHTIRLWDAETGKLAGQPLHGHTNIVTALSYSVDGRWLASGSFDMTVRVWDVATWHPAASGVLPCNGFILTVAYSPDGKYLAAAGFGGFIHLWQSGTNKLTRTIQANPTESVGFDTDSTINSIAFSPDATRIMFGASDNLVSIWDVEHGHQVLVLEGHVQTVCSIAYSPNGQYVASGSTDRSVRIWHAETGELVATLFGHGGEVSSVAFTPDERFIVSSARDGTIRSWDVATALALFSRVGHDPLAKLASAPTNEDGWLVGSAGELLLWLPSEYRGYMQLPPCSMIIAPHRIFLPGDELENNLHLGDQWTACWRGTADHIL